MVALLSPGRRKRGPLTRLAHGGQADSRKRRYIITALGGTLIVWPIAIAYIILSPRTYTSAFVMVLPGPGAASTMSLESVGSASTTSSSVFSSPDMSPTENYRKLILSHRMLTAAAILAEEPPESFPPPKVDLVDQTKLINVSTTGRSPAAAVVRAQAVRTAFLNMLDSLRQDEISQREEMFRSTLGGYKDRLQQARERLIEHQAHTGLVSLDQYGTMVASLERLREQKRDIDSRLVQSRSTLGELTRLLGTTPELATQAMVLRADPLFQTLLDTLAKQDAEIATLQGIRGQGNPRLQDAMAERASVLTRLAGRSAELTGLPRTDVLKLRDVSLRDERARMFERLISTVAEANALAAAQNQTAAQSASEQLRVIHLADEASKLENLRHEVQESEAVFTSALARMHTSQSDFFASYPMVQTLEAPLTPTRPTSPQPALAIGGGIGATFLIFAALVLSWLRLALLRKILKNG